MSSDKLTDLAQSVLEQKTSSEALVREALNKLEDNKEYFTVLTVLEENAVKRAKAIDQKVKNKEHVGRLAGIPFIAKDNFLVFGSETTAASNILKGFNAPYQATVIERLESEGAICIAKANLDAFGHGGSTENSDFGPTLNPVDKTKVPGGSSGGSAAAVALDIVPFALGTDTGGSSRQPASFSGCIGYKPTYGLLSRNGVIAMASSTDCVGVLARHSSDLSLLLEIMSGPDPLDGTTIDRQENYIEQDTSSTKPKLGIIKQYLSDAVSAEVKSAFEQTVETLKSQGFDVEEVDLPSLDYSVPTYYILVPAEISSNLSRYDGQKYGHSSQSASDLDSSYTKSRSEGFGAEAKRRILVGTYVLSTGYYDAYYKKAQLARTKIVADFSKAFKKYDFLISPCAPTTAFKFGEKSKNPLEMYLSDSMTVGASLAGIPALVLPTVKKPSPEHMPIGLQILADQRKDKELIQFGQKIEKEIVK